MELTTSETTKSSRQKSGGILWAVEPFLKNVETLKPLASLLKLWSDGHETTISPVTVVGPLEVNWPIELSQKVGGVFERAARESAAQSLKSLELPNLTDARVIVQASESQSDAVANLIELAEEHRCELIAVNTHGRRGWGRLFLGSFAEGLIANSPVPVLTINPKTVIPERIATILVPTDFSEESRQVFKTVIALAARFSARIVLLNRFVLPSSPYLYNAYGGALDAELIEQLFNEAEADRRTQGARWLAMAKNEGVVCDVKIDKNVDGLEHLILQTARNISADLIAMVSYTGRFGRALLGSTTRDTLLGATCPVMVVHAKRQMKN
jgi:nucleotide-binding universal stress UspA family protein